eukprot:COSAG01_NODE_9341_length_2478_cov_1.635982_4_plen_105_part_00
MVLKSRNSAALELNSLSSDHMSGALNESEKNTVSFYEPRYRRRPRPDRRRRPRVRGLPGDLPPAGAAPAAMPGILAGEPASHSHHMQPRGARAAATRRRPGLAA